MKMKSVIVGLVCAVAFVSCTENERAKAFGGTMSIDIPKGNKLVTATWKEAELWYLYKPRAEGEQPVTSILQEDSNFGMLEGKVVFNEQ
jgi:hypothetical protein